MSISVVVTTYNGAAFVVEQLESIFRQTKQPDEVLIFDDCSSDNTVEIVNEFIVNNNLSHWILEVNKTNKGWKENFKQGLLKARGDIVFPCDQDDIWRADKLEICEYIMDTHPDILVLTTNYEKFGDCRRKIVPNTNDKKVVQLKFDGNLFKIKYPGCSYCIRSSFIRDIENNWTPNSPHDATIWRYAIIRNGLYSFNDNLLLWRVYNTSTFELELNNGRNYKKKREWLDYAMQVLSDVEAYLLGHKEFQTEQIMTEIDVNKRFIRMRMDLYDHLNVLAGLRLSAYLKYYAAPIQYIGDWLYALRK